MIGVLNIYLVQVHFAPLIKVINVKWVYQVKEDHDVSNIHKVPTSGKRIPSKRKS